MIFLVLFSIFQLPGINFVHCSTHFASTKFLLKEDSSVDVIFRQEQLRKKYNDYGRWATEDQLIKLNIKNGLNGTFFLDSISEIYFLVPIDSLSFWETTKPELISELNSDLTISIRRDFMHENEGDPENSQYWLAYTEFRLLKKRLCGTGVLLEEPQ